MSDKKTEIKQAFQNFEGDCLSNNKPITRDSFVKSTGISRKLVDKIFGSFSNLKNSIVQEVDNKEKNMVSIKANSLEEVLVKCNVDLSVWEVDYFNTKELSSGEFSWTVYFKKKKGLTVISEDKIFSLLKEISKVEPLKKYEDKNSGLLYEFFFPDLHVNKLAHFEETGENVDSKITLNNLRKAISVSIERAEKFPISRILLPLGNDFFNIDNNQSTTTAGTPQDADTRYYKMFRNGYKFVVETIERLKQIAPVDVIIIPGNHDQTTCFYLGEVLSAFYSKDENVIVDNRATLRKYYQWGANLLGFTHGDKEKTADLALIMATEAKKEWSNTKYRMWHLGHTHTRKVMLDEKAGVISRVFPSLSGTDAWHHSKGYIGNIKGMTSCIFDLNDGLIAEINYNL
jgi:hypothetical protein